MAAQQLQILNEYNQNLTTTVEVDGELISIGIFLTWNRMAGYWIANIKDIAKDEWVISSMPLLANQNLLGQYGYLKIGTSALVNIGGGDSDNVTEANFGTEFIWCWDDNAE